MKSLFKLLAFIFALAGFFMPLLWVLAIISLLAALVCKTPVVELREDGKPKTDGLLGGAWDYAIMDHKRQKGQLPDNNRESTQESTSGSPTRDVSLNAITCPFCLGSISKEALKCQHCGEWLEKADELPKPPPTSQACPKCMHENGLDLKVCSRCGEQLEVA